MGEGTGERASMRRVVVASAAGTAFEWYDFFIFGALAPVIAKVFFAGLTETAGFIAALGLFAAGFAFRPLGAILFGTMGDRLGRKGAFLITVSLMGGATFAIGLLPTYAQAGIWGPALLILMRIFQGMALGGEYGGAAIYVAEHSKPDKRGQATGWIQASAAFGLIAALVVVLATRTSIGEDAFAAWGWRVPFLVSAGLLAISIWMRLKLTESPTFQKMKAEGEVSRAPLAEAFGQWSNIKLVLLAFFGVMCAQGALWYCFFFYSQVFFEKSLQVPPTTVNVLIMAMTLVSAPFYVLFGWLSDKIGRKPVMLGGMIVGLIAFFPAFHALAGFTNPALVEAQARTPVVVAADPASCSVQFDPVGAAKFSTACDIVKSVLASSGIPYRNAPLSAGATTEVRIGDQVIQPKDGSTLSADALKALKADETKTIRTALQAAGYPMTADTARMNYAGIGAILLLFVIAATALYGPMAAMLVELFPARVRYTALSLPYHVGTGWVGGFLPVTAFAIVAMTGDLYAGLWYPVIFTAISVITMAFLVPETRGRPLDA
ncbi:Predicted arabinose efflux permease, MFS family [Sphingomonas laterariae]|uniref:Predicted arabinose efflux permease, MFS family n=1 Tax=Edaphosphingomonas laterariae TaxID=861865 RepID=A0A239BCC6_9SPHN|nr:MFS transporter [Sphingomonas laterariae]SNS04643.1 Predicted arabinose efflux permease, MFS family [Sphingomonas laterariae]